MSRGRLRYRTHATSLTDDELVLLDGIFLLGRVDAGALYTSEYPIHNNRPYNHTLTDEQVVDTLLRWRREGL